MKHALDSDLLEVFHGRQAFDWLVARHRGYFRSLALTIGRRWRLPVWVAPEDVEQDVLVGAWECLWNYDATRGVSISGYLTYNAFDRAKKRAHKARGAKRSGNKADSNPSRWEPSYSRVWGEHADRLVEERHSQPAEQEERLEYQWMVDALQRRCAETEVEREVVATAKRMGCLEEVMVLEPEALAALTVAMYRSAEVRMRCGLRGERGALEAVVEAAARVAGRATRAFEAA